DERTRLLRRLYRAVTAGCTEPGGRAYCRNADAVPPGQRGGDCELPGAGADLRNRHGGAGKGCRKRRSKNEAGGGEALSVWPLRYLPGRGARRQPARPARLPRTTRPRVGADLGPRIRAASGAPTPRIRGRTAAPTGRVVRVRSGDAPAAR